MSYNWVRVGTVYSKVGGSGSHGIPRISRGEPRNWQTVPRNLAKFAAEKCEPYCLAFCLTPVVSGQHCATTKTTGNTVTCFPLAVVTGVLEL